MCWFLFEAISLEATVVFWNAYWIYNQRDVSIFCYCHMLEVLPSIIIWPWTVPWHVRMAMSLYGEWQQECLYPIRGGKDAMDSCFVKNHPIFKYLFQCFYFMLLPFPTFWNLQYNGTVPQVMYPWPSAYFCHLLSICSFVQVVINGRSARYMDTYSPPCIPKWWQVISDKDDVFWTSDTSSHIFFSFLSDWHLEKGNCLGAVLKGSDGAWYRQSRFLSRKLH